VGKRDLVWQPAWKYIKDADLIIVVQESKLLLNYFLLLLNFLGLKRMALWGHGKSFQPHRVTSLGERLKGFMTRHVSWWFAYTEESARAVADTGFPQEKITVVHNSIDTRGMAKLAQSLTQKDLNRAREAIGLKGFSNAIFAGGMYPDKRLEFLLQACEGIKRAVDDFEMIFIGAGPSAPVVRKEADRKPWIHYLGPRFGIELILYLTLSRVMLMPGLVGLSILDSFAIETPLVTTDVNYHSPEISYLRDGFNGIVVQDPESIEAYSAAVIRLLTEDDELERLRAGCRSSREMYTLEAMVENFRTGILRALDDNGFSDR
jgi:glycosyltransferase involved in cell wall biosynthesis